MRSENIKVVEIRDRETMIVALAIRILPSEENELFLFKVAGYRVSNNPCIILMSLQMPSYSAISSDDWYRSSSSRTMGIAHEWIEKNFDMMKNCQLIDVEYLLKEKERPCESIIVEELMNISNIMNNEIDEKKEDK